MDPTRSATMSQASTEGPEGGHADPAASQGAWMADSPIPLMIPKNCALGLGAIESAIILGAIAAAILAPMRPQRGRKRPAR